MSDGFRGDHGTLAAKAEFSSLMMQRPQALADPKRKVDGPSFGAPWRSRLDSETILAAGIQGSETRNCEDACNYIYICRCIYIYICACNL